MRSFCLAAVAACLCIALGAGPARADADIISLTDGGDCWEAQVGFTGDVLGGQVTIGVMPDRITFAVLYSKCYSDIPFNPEFEFFLNGVSLGTFEAGICSGPTDPNCCLPDVPEAIFTFDDPTLLSSWNPTGPNTIRFRTIGDAFSLALAYVRAEIEAGGQVESVCVVELNDLWNGEPIARQGCDYPSDVPELALFVSGYGHRFFYDESITLTSSFDDGTIAAPFTGVEPPETVGISDLADGSYTMCIVTQEEVPAPPLDEINLVLLGMNCYCYGETYTLSLNGVAIGTLEPEPWGVCTCSGVPRSLLINDPSALANWQPGTNTFTLTPPEPVYCELYLGWARVEITWQGVVEKVCIADYTNSGCTSTVSCAASVLSSPVTVTTDVFPDAGYGTTVASSKSCVAFEKQGETSILINGDGTGCTSFVRVSGNATSDCGDALAGTTVTLTDGSGVVSTTSVASDGSYIFEEVPTSNNPGTVAIDVPASFAAGAGGASRAISLAADATADFALECIFVDITGTVTSNCAGGLTGVTVDLVRDGANADNWGGVFITSAGPGGAYSFENIRYSDADTDHISIVVPLGFEAVTPEDGASLVSLEQDGALDFTLQCNQPSGQARSMGYWKHQTNVHLSGRGEAQESAADMSINYPDLIFNHFHENLLNAIEVEGVTYVIDGGAPAPLDLETIDETLSVRGNAGMLARAKQQYLAMLLNMASEKLLSTSVVSTDGATASQALQYVAFLINDASASNDELAKNICDTINNAQLVAAGVIPLDINNIIYALPRADGDGSAGEVSLQVSPNPGRQGVYSFALDVPAAGDATLAIYDTSGRLIATPLSGAVAAGRSQVAWDARNMSDGGLSQGVYFARLSTAAGNRSVKIVHMNR